jgi:hypothetical protein
MRLLQILALAALSEAAPQFGGGAGGNSLIRFGCSEVVVTRLDPYVPHADPRGTRKEDVANHNVPLDL